MKSLLPLTIVISLSIPALANFVATGTSKGMKFQVELIKDELGVPWGFDFLNQQEIIFTERKGNLKILDQNSKTVRSISGLPKIYVGGQGGLLDVKKHPDFKKNSLIYFTYSKKVGKKMTTAVARGKLVGDKLTGLEDLFVGKTNSSTGQHFGSRIVFDGKGYIFVSIGDRGKRHKAQDLGYHNGKIIRLKEDGSVPKDNPFYNKKGALKEIWSYGHRNPQGLALHPVTKQLWEQEHGPRGGDEINLIRKGANYGWPVITYGKEYYGPSIGEGTHKKGMEQPVKYYAPSIAPCGLNFYFGDKLPKWKGSLFSGALKLRHINRVELDGPNATLEERLLEDKSYRVRHIKEGPDGFLYFSVDEGKILRIRPQISKK